MLGKVYKITNNINGKVYIGQTIKSLKDRFERHCWENRGDNHFYMPIKRAIKKYGKENFKIELIEECSTDILSEREIYWIDYYNSYKSKKGYNCTKGGEGGRGCKLSKEEELEVIRLQKSGAKTVELAIRFNVDKTTIANILKRHGEKVIIWDNIENRINMENLINDIDNKMTITELVNKHKISDCSIYNFVKRYNIEHNTSKSVHSLSNRRGKRCTLNYINGKDIELQDKELVG